MSLQKTKRICHPGSSIVLVIDKYAPGQTSIVGVKGHVTKYGVNEDTIWATHSSNGRSSPQEYPVEHINTEQSEMVYRG